MATGSWTREYGGEERRGWGWHGVRAGVTRGNDGDDAWSGVNARTNARRCDVRTPCGGLSSRVSEIERN